MLWGNALAMEVVERRAWRGAGGVQLNDALRLAGTFDIEGDEAVSGLLDVLQHPGGL